MAEKVREEKQDEALQGEIERLNELLGDVSPYRIGIADPVELVPADINARYMTKEQYDQLVANIKRDGGLASLPLCWRDKDGVNHILSGHHRTDAARDAGLKQILYLYTDADLSEQQRTAIQISHNSIVGQDDINILREQWQRLSDLEAKAYTGLDDDYFQAFEPVKLAPFNEANLTFRKVEIMFLPEDLDELVEAMNAIGKSKHTKLIASERDFDVFTDAVMALKDHANVYNTATVVLMMAHVAEKYCAFLDEHGREPDDGEWEAIHEDVTGAEAAEA